MGCVTSLAQPLRGCRLEPLGRMAYVAVASPAFAAAALEGRLTRHNFHRVPFVAFNRKDDMQTEFVSRSFGLKQVSLTQLYVPSSEGQVRAIRAGWGVSVVPEQLVREDLRRGALVNVAPAHQLSIQLYWHCWNLQSDVLEALTSALTHAAAEHLR